MNISFVQIGDTHLREQRLADILAALDQVIDEGCLVPDLGAWLWPGDLHDARSTVETRNALRLRVKRMADRAPVIICYGNHDIDGDLDIFGDLSARYPIHVVAVPQVLRLELAPDGGTREQGRGIVWLSVFVLPYPTTAGLVAAGLPSHEIPQAARAALEAIFLDAGHMLEDARNRGDVTAMIGHANLAGAVPSIGQPPIGAEIELDGGLLAHLGPVYIGLNHIHAAQTVHPADYAGSICRLSWGEIDPKSYTVVHYARATPPATGNSLTDMKWYYHESIRHPLHVPPMYHVEGEFSRAGFSWHVTKGPDGEHLVGYGPGTDWSGCEVRARMRYKQSEGIVLADAQRDVKAVFRSALRFEFEPVCEPDRAVRAPAVALARTLPEKVAAWADVTGVVLPSDVAVKLVALEMEDADTLVARETEALERLATDGAAPAVRERQESLI